MNPTRHDFLKGALAALGFSALPGGLFAAPKGWKIKKKPHLVFGILSDTHLQSGWDGVTPHRGFPLTYVINAMKLFRSCNIDAFMHLGDMAHRGKNVEVQYHRDIFDKFFPRGVRSSDKSNVEKLLVVGNHELFGNAVGGTGAWAPNIWKDPVERAKHVLCADLPRYWEQIWGEKYEECWHKEVNGYHFFGRHWETAEMKLAQFINSKAEECSLKGTRPFFILSHARNHHQFRRSLKEFPNAVSFFGHWHCSNADWKTIYYDGWSFPEICCGACRNDGQNTLDANENVLRERETTDRKNFHINKVPSRQAMIVNVYDDMVVFERHEVGEGGKLGPDWVLPLSEFKPHPFTRNELKKVIGEPQFGKKAKLEVKLEKKVGVGERNNSALELELKTSTVLRIKIPLADGNPASRVFAYDVVIVGEDRKARMFKSVYFEGCNVAPGHEPNDGITEVEIPVAELPAGKNLTIAIRPISSLGTKGKSIGTTIRV